MAIELVHFPKTCPSWANFCRVVNLWIEAWVITSGTRNWIIWAMEDIVSFIWQTKRNELAAWYAPEGLMRPIKEMRTNVSDTDGLTIIAERFAVTVDNLFEPKTIH